MCPSINRLYLTVNCYWVFMPLIFRLLYCIVGLKAILSQNYTAICKVGKVKEVHCPCDGCVLIRRNGGMGMREVSLLQVILRYNVDNTNR